MILLGYFFVDLFRHQVESVRAHTLGVVSQPAEKLLDLPALLEVKKEPVE